MPYQPYGSGGIPTGPAQGWGYMGPQNPNGANQRFMQSGNAGMSSSSYLPKNNFQLSGTTGPTQGATDYSHAGLDPNIPITPDPTDPNALHNAIKANPYGQNNPGGSTMGGYIPGAWGMNGQGGQSANQWATGGDYHSMQPPTAPNYQTAPNNTGFNSQYATWDNIQPYMNPYLDKIIAQGTNAIQNSGAARGLTSNTFNDIGNWATNATQQAYQNAIQNFDTDRGYMTGQYNTNRQMNDNEMNAANNFNYDVYSGNFNAYNNMMGNNYAQNNTLAQYGPNAAAYVSQLAMETGMSTADIYNMLGMTNAQSAANTGSNTGGLINTIGGALIPGLITAAVA